MAGFRAKSKGAGTIDFDRLLAYLCLEMVQRIKDLLRASPFVPFKVKTSDGSEYLVPTPDHAAVVFNSRVLIFGDDESQKTLSGLHIVAIEETSQPAR